MAKGVVDVYVSKKLDQNNIVLVVNGGCGLPNDLHLIRDGSTVTLSRGNTHIEVKATHEEETEYSFDYMEIDAITAARLGIRHGSRYSLETDEGEHLFIQMQPINTSEAEGIVYAEPKSRTDTIVIGYTLLCWLGMPDKKNTVITLRRGNLSSTLKLNIPPNQLDTDLRLSPGRMSEFALSPGKQLKLRYDRVTKTLEVLSQETTVTANRTKQRSIPKKSALKTAKPPAQTPKMEAAPVKPALTKPAVKPAKMQTSPIKTQKPQSGKTRTNPTGTKKINAPQGRPANT
ncbi:hypothetical protein [Paenibacillus xerothermodurans]|uniref:Uncharacterized protein n=1 Tax=Paenibacillus xerothermodurans TaxID=1977292 RepID=A0A2W1NXB8_PAEXE|nr:hypothetical protein [Paenibacillus xerothermodurans]PZE19498.1 hypothetical protein CBW46_018345 [Paenibacillus xerothermodurans]